MVHIILWFRLSGMRLFLVKSCRWEGNNKMQDILYTLHKGSKVNNSSTYMNESL